MATAAPDAVLRAAAETPQQQVIAWLVGHRRGATPDVTVLDRLVTTHPGLLLTESATNLALPPAQWPLRTTLAAWRAPADGAAPQITITSDAVRVLVRASWSADRWWERCWPTRPLLDAPSRSWAAVDGAVIIADGTDQLLVLDQRTGDLLVGGDVTGDIEPAAVIRVGLTGAAVLIDQGRTLQVLTRAGGQRIALKPPGTSIRSDSTQTVEVQHRDGSTQRMTLTISPEPAAGSPAGASGAP